MTETRDPAYGELFDAVIAVAAAPPDKPKINRHSCYVPWSRILRLRAALDAAGIDWRTEVPA